LITFLGESLGKAGGSGLVNPIIVEVKNNRFGLGRDAVLKEIREQKEELRRRHRKRRERETAMTPDEFRYNCRFLTYRPLTIMGI
jgi:hypothetical protein